METLAAMLLTLVPFMALTAILAVGVTLGQLVARFLVRRREEQFARRFVCPTERERMRLTPWD